MEDKDVQIDQVSINEATTEKSDTTQDTPQPTKDTANCGTQVDALIAEIKELNDKYLRTAAELENTRRRATLDAQSLATRRAMGVAEKILPVMDAIDAALTHSPDDAGIQSMARAMESAFAQIGITKIESIGQILNPQFHNAIQVTDRPNEMKDCAPNTIITEMQPGYMFGDVVLRTAMVIVCK
ncbi:MAG: nucleotide exchange factor GrpE [Muribaculaceae bacterium]|nr:nucleotide exchange factor GrpE [Muribaculaceae bacterium]